MMSDEEIQQKVDEQFKTFKEWDGEIIFIDNELDAIRLNNAFLEFFNSSMKKEDDNRYSIHVHVKRKV